MDIQEETLCFDRMTVKYGSKFEAIRQISKDARAKKVQCKNVITESEAITWALTGKQPHNLAQRMNRAATRKTYNPTSFYQEEYMKDLLCYIDDSDICDSVIASFHASKRSHNLVYKYIGNISDENKARVRILTNMVWYYKHTDY